jgi:hypothetical protein
LRSQVTLAHLPTGDYKVGQTFLRESATVIQLCNGPPPEESLVTSTDASGDLDKTIFPRYKSIGRLTKYQSLTKYLIRKDSAPPEHRLLITAVGIKPTGKSSQWTSCLKHEESSIRYLMLNGVPSIVIPAKTGCPLIAWDTLTLASLYKLEKEKKDAGIQGVVDVILEYLTFCVDWDRVVLPSTTPTDSPGGEGKVDVEKAKESLRNAVAVLVAGVVKSKDTRTVREEVDLDRAGIVMFRIP